MKCPVCHQKMRAIKSKARDDFYCRKCQLKHYMHDKPNRFHYIVSGHYIDFYPNRNESVLIDLFDPDCYWTYAGLLNNIEIEFFERRCKKLQIFA